MTRAITPPDDDRVGSGQAADSSLAIYHDVARVIERMQRRFHDVIRVELGRLGVDDISPMQVVMLMNIGNDELTVRDLMERGYYLGSNASYNLKNLVEQGYVDRGSSQRDRRAARLSLSEKGYRLWQEIRRLDALRLGSLFRDPRDLEDLEITYKTLRRLERLWGDVIRYDARDLD